MPMTLTIGRVSYPCVDLADASRLYQIARNKSGKGASAFPVGRVGDYLISYNGRVWEKGDWKPGRAPILEATRLECVNCGESYKREVDCFAHCQRCIPDAIAATIHTVDDLRAFQRSCGAYV